MDNNTLKKYDEEFDYYRKNNIYPIVNKDLVKRILDLKVNDKIKDDNKFITESYMEQMDKLNELNKEQLKHYLMVLKNADIKDNQKLEKEDSFLLSLYMQSERKHAIDELLKHEILKEDVLLKTHNILLQGTNNSNTNNLKYRDNNRTFVGTYENGIRNIHYLTLNCNEIDYAMNLFLDYYNEKDSFDDIFFKPFAIHGMLAALQVFEDGNTRLSRLLQNIKLYKLTNKLGNYNFSNPTLYVTRTYFPHRLEYRNLIAKLAIDTNEENLNNWYSFNLKRAEETIWKNDENINKIKIFTKK